MKPFTTLAVAIFALIALAHLARLIWGFEVRVDGAIVPHWISAAGLLLAGGLALMVWREARP